ncbi:Arabinanase/levansucrase/invertase [Thozetella sp. PMI_491]|nr:Arabinanase/levansucrase/invertase [Thozetella sp. PMI_491]
MASSDVPALDDPVVFENPVIRGFNPDPTVCVVPATATSPATYFLSTSTFEFFPGCAIYASTDLRTWKLIGHALNRRSQIDLRTVEPGAGSWASTLRYRPDEKRFYLANGVFHRYRPATDERIFPRGFYVYTDNIWDESAWSDPIYFDNPGFDQDLFWDDDGKVYLSTTTRLAVRPLDSKLKDFAIHISEIDLQTGRTLTAPIVIRESPHGIAEGSHIIKRRDWYYLFTAEGGTEAGHQEWCLRSKVGPLGPWEGSGKPLWYNGPDEEVQRTGHADVFEDAQGRWWAVLLGVRPVRGGGKWLEPQLGRESFLVKVDWIDDWPVFNDGHNITLLTRGRDHVPRAHTSEPGTLVWQDALNEQKLELGWYQKNTPLKISYSLTERPGFLRLYGGPYELSSPEAPTMLLRKQTSYRERFKTRLVFNPRKQGYEAGVVLWWNQYSYATIGIARISREGGVQETTLLCRAPTGCAGDISIVYPLVKQDGSRVELEAEAMETTGLELAVECRPTSYKLSVTGGSVSHSVEVPAEKLTVAPPVGACFTGVMYGIYSCGKGEPVLDAADFWDIDVRTL